ncbi:DUF2249 domain-containing protein [Acidaminococcus timonensis]|uniref:DUF2249 domain-containing protein n=1 Tax=Acidaminococcus timonensis TaxID=1871002 RepID=UPI0025DBB7F1|nr:DUF2249 domain-containing protein [Acidaminococcus timonensis]
MEHKAWMANKDEFQVIDLRSLQGNFSQGLFKKADALPQGAGLHLIQDFQPYPLYEALADRGYEYEVEQQGPSEFHIYFYRKEVKEASGKKPFGPAALLNFPLIDKNLGQIAVAFWDETWNDERHYLNYEMRLLLSLANAVGAGRMRQATRELVKAYMHGIDSRALDDVFELLAWNQGIGFFSSEIGPSPLFQAYKLIKLEEKKGTPRGQIKQLLLEKFGEKNQAVKVL